MNKEKILFFIKSIITEVTDKLKKDGKEVIGKATGEFYEKAKNSFEDTIKDKMFGNNNESPNSSNSNNEENDNPESYFTFNQTLEGDIPNPNFHKDFVDNFDSDFTFKNEETFQNENQGILNGIITNQIFTKFDPTFVLKELITAASEVAKFSEVQVTKRTEIEAKRDENIAKINAQKEILLIYLEKSFDERKDNFERLFNVIDYALINNNMEQLALGLNSINHLAATSPFKDLANISTTQQALNNKNHLWDI